MLCIRCALIVFLKRNHVAGRLNYFWNDNEEHAQREWSEQINYPKHPSEAEIVRTCWGLVRHLMTAKGQTVMLKELICFGAGSPAAVAFWRMALSAQKLLTAYSWYLRNAI